MRHNAHERALRAMYDAWLGYAEAHSSAYGKVVGDGGALGEDWGAIGHALIRLLNGKTGNIDCAAMGRNIRAALAANKCKRDV